MADRPILFSAPMVRALIREAQELGTGKTMHREVLKLPKNKFAHPKIGGWAPCTNGGGGCFRFGRGGERIPVQETVGIWHQTTGYCMDAPYQVGDRLWVRETWAPLGALTHDDPGVTALIDRGFYRADESTVDGEVQRWQPSGRMPRDRSRLTLIVTEVRVERLNDISEADAQAEGVEPTTCANVVYDGEGFPSYRSGFGILWNSLYGPDAWQANPWVSVTRFRPILVNIDALAQAEPSQNREAVR